LPGTDNFVVWTTVFPYALANLPLLCVVTGCSHQPIGRTLKPWSIVVSLSAILPVVVRFVIRPVLAHSAGAPATLLALRLGDIFISVILAVCVCSLFLRTGQLSWSLLCAGIFALVFGDWATQVQAPFGGAPPLGVYEFFWAFGIFSIAA